MSIQLANIRNITLRRISIVIAVPFAATILTAIETIWGVGDLYVSLREMFYELFSDIRKVWSYRE